MRCGALLGTLWLLLGASGCERVKQLVSRKGPAPAALDGGGDAAAGTAAHGGDLGAPHSQERARGDDQSDGGDKALAHQAADGASGSLDPGAPGAGDGKGPELEAEYTPRRLIIDEEDCDEVTRDALQHLRAQAKALADKQRELEERAQSLKAREEAHARAAAQVEARVKELGRLGAELDEKIARAADPHAKEAAGESRARRAERAKAVSRMVSGMTTQRAATLLSEFKDDELAVEVLQSLPQEVAGKVLGQMRPASAARLAERIGADKEGAKP